MIHSPFKCIQPLTHHVITNHPGSSILDPGSGLIIFLFQRLTTTRNVLLANMALSNLALCVFTMPLTLLDMLHHYWPLASGQEVLCKLTSHTQSTFVFFSSWSVMLIAVDRLAQ